MKSENTKIIVASIAAGIAGILFGAYICSKKDEENPVSSKLKVIAKAIEQLENIDTEDAQNLKEKLNSFLINLNSTYEKSKE